MPLAPLRRQGPLSLANFFAPGVKPTCPPVQNLNETTAAYALNSKLVGVTFQICQHDRAGHMDRQTDRWMDRQTDNFVLY